MEWDKIEAAGGVLYREGRAKQVLLIRRRGVWDLPKGKREPGESREECARREVAEEVGLPELPAIESFLTPTWHRYEEGGRKLRKQTFWYAMRCEGDPPLIPQREEGIEEAAWTPLEEARERVGYENLREVLRAFGSWLEEEQNSGTAP